MRQPTPLLAKSTNRKEESDSVVVSFGFASYQPLLETRFKAVIRKRVPRTLTPKWIYIHVNAPISSICARAELLSVEHISLEEAVGLARELDMSEADIVAYVGSETEIGCYRLGRIEFPRKRLTVSELSRHMVYNAPQSFFVLSRKGKEMIDRMVGFAAGENKSKQASR